MVCALEWICYPQSGYVCDIFIVGFVIYFHLLLLTVQGSVRLTPHSRTLEVRPGRINKKLELHYDYDVKGMILNYYSVSQMYDLVLLCDRLDSVIGYNSTCNIAT